jgi:hypothetical protein
VIARPRRPSSGPRTPNERSIAQKEPARSEETPSTSADQFRDRPDGVRGADPVR